MSATTAAPLPDLPYVPANRALVYDASGRQVGGFWDVSDPELSGFQRAGYIVWSVLPGEPR